MSMYLMVYTLGPYHTVWWMRQATVGIGWLLNSSDRDVVLEEISTPDMWPIRPHYNR